MSEELAAELLGFWTRERALDESAARSRLSEVVCVGRDRTGEIAGVNSVYPHRVNLIGDQPFWMYRSLLLPPVARADTEMINAAFAALEAEFEPASGGPIGLCLVVDPAETGRRPGTIWPDTQLMLAACLEDGRQVRIRYFDGAVIGPGLPNSPTLADTGIADYSLEESYRIQPLGEASGATPDDMLAFWDREGALPPAEAQRRVHEVLLVAIERAEGVVGVSTASLQRNPRLRMDLWQFRVFVARAHRMSNLALLLAVKARDLLERRFITGEDRRGAGIVY